jgi:hypothetical protein
LVETDMSVNFHTGMIPTEIGSLNRLEILSLDTNLLSGPLPTEIGNLVALRTSSVVIVAVVYACDYVPF